jgi:Type IV secretion system pilin
MEDIPRIIVSIIQFLIGIAGTMSIVALIYNSVQMQLHSGITGDSTGVENAKKWMYGALLGFVLAILAWFLVTRFVEILTTVSAS